MEISVNFASDLRASTFVMPLRFLWFRNSRTLSSLVWKNSSNDFGNWIAMESAIGVISSRFADIAMFTSNVSSGSMLFRWRILPRRGFDPRGVRLARLSNTNEGISFLFIFSSQLISLFRFNALDGGGRLRSSHNFAPLNFILVPIHVRDFRVDPSKRRWEKSHELDVSARALDLGRHWLFRRVLGHDRFHSLPVPQVIDFMTIQTHFLTLFFQRSPVVGQVEPRNGQLLDFVGNFNPNVRFGHRSHGERNAVHARRHSAPLFDSGDVAVDVSGREVSLCSCCGSAKLRPLFSGYCNES